MSALAVFTREGHDLRTLLVDGEPWFVAADVARMLGHTSTATMTRRLDDDDKGVQRLHTLGGEQEFVTINEPGLYSAILGSHIPEAKAFKRWVTHEVLPAIRRTGQYVPVPQRFSEALALAAEQQRRIEEQEAQMLVDAPKVEAYDQLMDADGFYTMEAAAKVLGVGRNTLFRRLRDQGVLLRGSNLPAQRYAHHFKVTAAPWCDKDGGSHVAHTTRVLPTALDWLRKRLDEGGA